MWQIAWPTYKYVLDITLSTRFVKIPDSNGFVVPTSIDELWQPQDLKQPQCLLALGFPFRNGEFRHVFPAIDLSFNGNHRNRGLNTVPRAYQRMEFGMLVVERLDNFSPSLSICEENEEEWKTLTTVDSIEKEINYAVESIADSPPVEMEDGSFVVHVVCAHENVVTCPKPGSEIRALLLEENDPVGTLQVRIEKTAAGSESEYLPETYKTLFS